MLFYNSLPGINYPEYMTVVSFPNEFKYLQCSEKAGRACAENVVLTIPFDFIVYCYDCKL